ncbi:MAG: hypothetical protein M0D57_13905 [Sphingobacteriales bacterium JAD_PAG50586_3]|nr:MAG: hypothetical protein M0D57_13905 [Sphingobacteriales bacterium JAD_PAG50586_3]
MKLTGFDNEWDALQNALQGPTGKAYTEADLKADSAMPLQKLKKQWDLRIVFTLAIAPIWLVAVFYFNEFIIQLLMGLVFISNLWSLYISFNLKSKLKKGVNSNLPVLENIKITHNLISTAIRLEERVFIFIYPISVAAGFFAGLSMSGAVNNIANNPQKALTILTILGVCIVVLTPLSHFMAKWLNKLAFGNYLKELKRVIESYENDKQ